jgi:hypothetical protein
LEVYFPRRCDSTNQFPLLEFLSLIFKYSFQQQSVQVGQVVYFFNLCERTGNELIISVPVVSSFKYGSMAGIEGQN